MKYTVYASLYEDVNAGWIWVGTKLASHRPVVRVTNTTNGKTVYCEALHIEDNFKNRYNRKRTTLPISDPVNSVVMNEWYRQRLGIPDAQASVDFEIKPANNIIGKFRANISHPQILVRQAMCLALISVLLGLLSVALTIIPFVSSFCARPTRH